LRYNISDLFEKMALLPMKGFFLKKEGSEKMLATGSLHYTYA
jgi:hypothetical protein